MSLVCMMMLVFIFGVLVGSVCYYYSGLLSKYEIDMQKRMTSMELKLSRLINTIEDGFEELKNKIKI